MPRRHVIGAGIAAFLGYVTLGTAWHSCDLWNLIPRSVRPLGDAAFGWMVHSTSCDPGGEVSAISTLRNIASCQEQFRSAAAVDTDGDGQGEYGGLLEMSAGIALRGRDEPLRPPVLSGAFRSLRPGGAASRTNYLFRVYLLSADGAVVGELPGLGFEDAGVDPDLAERRFVCYAWPLTRRLAEQRTFVVDDSGNIHATSGGNYDAARPPSPGAAFTSGDVDSIEGVLADGVAGPDGNVWRQVN